MKSKWKNCSLGDLITFQRGHDLPKSSMITGIYPVVGSNGLIGYHNDFTTEYPSITIGRSGNVGKPFIVYGRSWSHNTTLYIKKFKNTDPIFIYYFLRILDLKNYAGGSAVPTLNRNHIHTLSVCVPKDLNEQKKIGKILKSLDDKIEINNKINENLEQQAKAIYANMFLNNTEHNFTKGKLGDIANITMGQSPKGSSYNENSIGEIFYQGRAEFGYRFPTRKLYTTEPKRIAETCDILMSVRAPVGDINVAYEPCCIGRGLSAIQNKDKNSSFMLYTMFSLKSKLDIFNGEGTVFGSINSNDLKEIPVNIPNDNDIQRFEKIVRPMDMLIRTNYEENCRLQTLRDSLLPKLMSGEIDVENIKL